MHQSFISDVAAKGMSVQVMELKNTTEAGSFSGYASVFRIPDRQGDVIEPGAFAESLQKRAGEIRLLWQHDPAEPIGIFHTIREDAVGLYVEGRILLDVQRGKEAHSLLKSGALEGLSIGYTPVRFRHDPATGHRMIEALDLWEISLVTFPANPEAGVRRIKGRREAAVKAPSRTLHAEDVKTWDVARRSGDGIRLLDAISRAERVLAQFQR